MINLQAGVMDEEQIHSFLKSVILYTFQPFFTNDSFTYSWPGEGMGEINDSPGHFICGTHYVRGWVQSRSNLDVLKIKCPYSDLSPLLARNLGPHGIFVCFTYCFQLLWVPLCLSCKVKFLVWVHRAAKY